MSKHRYRERAKKHTQANSNAGMPPSPTGQGGVKLEPKTEKGSSQGYEPPNEIHPSNPSCLRRAVTRTSIGEWLMVLFTFGIAFATVVYMIYAGGMWEEMRKTGAYSRLGQRAWISLSFGTNVPLENGQLFIQPITFTNTGKTPAKKVTGKFVTMMVGRNDLPGFSYAHGMAFPDGIMFPGGPNPIGSVLSDYSKDAMPQPIVLTQAIRQALGAGQAFIVTYGNIAYDDVFGENHWLHFCTVGPQATVPLYAGWKACYQYNDDDTKVP